MEREEILIRRNGKQCVDFVRLCLCGGCVCCVALCRVCEFVVCALRCFRRLAFVFKGTFFRMGLMGLFRAIVSVDCAIGVRSVDPVDRMFDESRN